MPVVLAAPVARRRCRWPHRVLPGGRTCRVPGSRPRIRLTGTGQGRRVFPAVSLVCCRRRLGSVRGVAARWWGRWVCRWCVCFVLRLVVAVRREGRGLWLGPCSGRTGFVGSFRRWRRRGGSGRGRRGPVGLMSSGGARSLLLRGDRVVVGARSVAARWWCTSPWWCTRPDRRAGCGPCRGVLLGLMLLGGLWSYPRWCGGRVVRRR